MLAGTPRVIEVKGMDLDAPFGGVMLYVNNLDKPGFIGSRETRSVAATLTDGDELLIFGALSGG